MRPAPPRKPDPRFWQRWAAWRHLARRPDWAPAGATGMYIYYSTTSAPQYVGLAPPAGLPRYRRRVRPRVASEARA